MGFLFESILASKKDPTNVDILMTKASIYENLKQPKKKMEVYENILKVIMSIVLTLYIRNTIELLMSTYCNLS
jgi:predicted DNA-binding protein YlxM (UPF0122 family)